MERFGLSHYGLYHPIKPEKIRVDFYYSVKIDERSLGKELLTGPDLTNNIAGIIRKNGIAFVADVEAMYCQVMVPKNQHTFIKFRWWNDQNINEDPSDFVMCAHIFGGVY